MTTELLPGTKPVKKPAKDIVSSIVFDDEPITSVQPRSQMVKHANQDIVPAIKQSITYPTVNEQPTKPYNLVPPALRWIFIPTVANEPGEVDRPAPIEKIMMGLCGFSIWLCGAYMTALFMQNTFPAFKDLSKVSTGAAIAAIAASIIFMAIEVQIWKGGHTIFVWLLLFAFMAMDIFINIKGFAYLFGLKEYGLADIFNFSNGGMFVALVGTGLAVLPELFMKWAFNKK